MTCEEPSDFGYDIYRLSQGGRAPRDLWYARTRWTSSIQKNISYDEYMLQNNYVAAFFLGLSLADPWLHQLQTSHTPAVSLDNYIWGQSFHLLCGCGTAAKAGSGCVTPKGAGTGGSAMSPAGPFHVSRAAVHASFHALRKHNLPDYAAWQAVAIIFPECLQNTRPPWPAQNVAAIV